MTEPVRLHVIQGGRAEQPTKQPTKQPTNHAPSQPPNQPPKQSATPEPLWREVLGDQLRELRREHRESLAETAGRAGISPQYLSEVERGLKEPSSEMIAAVAGALGTTLGGLAESVAGELRVRREATLVISRREAATRVATRRPASGPVMLALAA
ncbi:transcriptional regulator, XRE family [Catenulispora acidiphila DSM 44928]|uniref:Transcriptional regulator, XRE family n=1 Tax=Catenulispora acidiphila (strain DSM 44928 / JCM 14897 / NBRC 102108 / NRRL B-24433 / ID139908) TaxID=479433 RepID=C7QFY0_CATAD|nr:helix-turn-helix transcriptional regulator [Catenulispora acidiphila]ACU70957.1 transcriptional regulator, XRE family [Catenulispora acidiphila DSM 44928]